MIRKLTEPECRYAMEHGEFEEALRGERSAIILTQSWCPQWTAMRNYLPKADEKAGSSQAGLYFIEYDLCPWFEEFMNFKENTFKNREIPYVRYYRDGKFFRDSNYISLEGFLSRLGIDGW
jgi:hypothetical protein